MCRDRDRHDRGSNHGFTAGAAAGAAAAAGTGAVAAAAAVAAVAAGAAAGATVVAAAGHAPRTRIVLCVCSSEGAAGLCTGCFSAEPWREACIYCGRPAV